MDIEVIAPPPNLEEEMSKDPDVIKYLDDRSIAILFYDALCNMEWVKVDILPEDERIMEKLKGIDSSVWSCSWRYAGGIIADIRNKHYNAGEDYMDFYCQGNEGVVDEIVSDCFSKLGWIPRPYKEDSL